MHYEINVSHNGKHLFATTERSIQGPHELKRVFTAIDEKFPESEGYTLLIRYYPGIGYGASIAGLREAISDDKLTEFTSKLSSR